MAQMVPHLILFKHTGEQAVTPKDPVAVVERVEGDTAYLVGGETRNLTDTVQCIWYWDDWRQVTEPLYEVKEVMLPDWLTPAEWLRNTITLRYAVAFGADLAKWPEAWVRAFAAWSEGTRYAIAPLLNANPARMRSDFRKKLRQQVIDWIENPEDRQYGSPLSPRQIACITHSPWEAERIATSVYRNRHFLGVEMKMVYPAPKQTEAA